MTVIKAIRYYIPMKLDAYLNEYEKAAALARRIGAFPSDVSDWRHGNRPVPVLWARRIYDATNGLVHVSDLRPNDWREYWPELVKNVNAA